VYKLALLLGSMLLVGRLGPLWVCVAVGWAYMTHAITCLYLVSLGGIPFAATLRGLATPLLACIPMVATVYAIRYGLGLAPLASLCLEIVLGAAAFAGAALVVARPIALDFIGLVKTLIARRRATRSPDDAASPG
jgi:hypothetical protein